MSAYTILVVDDILETARGTADLLGLQGHHVHYVTNAADALRLLAMHRIHLVILDLRLAHDNDPTDSGLTLAEQIDPHIPKIINTNFPSFDSLYYGVFPSSNQAHQIVDYVCKKDGPAVFLQRVQQALEKHVPINWQLNLRWSEQLPLWQRLSLLRLAEFVGAAGETALIAAQELGDLLRILFKEYQEIVVERVIESLAERTSLEVRAIRAERNPEYFLVVYGLKARVSAYEEKRDQYAPRDGEASALHLTLHAQTQQYAANAYLVSGVSLSQTALLGECYRSATASDTTKMLDYLLGKCLRSWSARAPIIPQPKLVTSFYQNLLAGGKRAPLESDLIQCSKAIAAASLRSGNCPSTVEHTDLVLTLANGSKRRLPLPVRALHVERVVQDSDHLTGMLNGALDRAPVLIDMAHLSCVLIEFEAATQGPLCVDYVALEHWLRCQHARTITLETRLACEELLLTMPNLTEPPSLEGLDPEAQKMMRAITRVRLLAGTQSAVRDRRAYYAGLLFFSLRHVLSGASPIGNDDPAATTNVAHSLICAALLCEWLLPGETGVRIDEAERLAVIDGRSVRMPPQLFRIFQYLYDRRGNVCKKEDILRKALDIRIDSAADLRDNEGMLQNLVSRLRSLIEPDPSQKRYLRTIPSIGYCLDLPTDPVD